MENYKNFYGADNVSTEQMMYAVESQKERRRAQQHMNGD